MRRIRTAVVDVSGDLPELDLSTADEWRIVVTHGNLPRAYFVMASPGVAGPATLELTLKRAGERAREEELYRKLMAGEPVHRPAALRVSVVVPTHRRPEVLVKLLASITDLDPEPDEVIVVDNDPGDQDCRALVDAVDFKYVREDRRGLNVARRRGLEAATGDVVVFTDDDCIVSPGWLAPVAEVFADPLVGVAAGPGFAWELDTGAQLRREEEAGFAKGLAVRRFDWRVLAPVNAGAVGSGNSMAVRRDAALALEVFPPELDAGTRAPAAGDLFAIFRFLSAGFDAVYEPRMLFWHRHPPGGLRATIRNYGHGAGAFYTKVLIEERELGVIGVWYWFVRRWFEALLDVQAGLADRGRLRVRWCYLKASLSGPLAWRRALSDLDPEGRRVLDVSRAAAHLPPSASGCRAADRRLATVAAWRARVRSAAVGGAEPVAMTTRQWLASGPGSPASDAPRLVAVAALLELLEFLRMRRAWASIAARVRGEPAPHANPRSAMTRAQWRAAAHAAAGRPGRVPPARDASSAVVYGPADAADREAYWRAVADAVAGSDAEVVAVPLRGAWVSDHWLAEVVAALEGSRVAAVVGAGLAPEDPPSVLGLFGRGNTRARFSGAGSPPQFIALRRDLYDTVGGIDGETARLGWTAPVLDYVERALDAGLTVGRLDTHGVEPAGTHRPARSVNEWHRSWARGALHAERARTMGGAQGLHAFVFSGVVPLLRFRRPDRTGRKSVRHTVGALAAFLLGALATGKPQPRTRRDV